MKPIEATDEEVKALHVELTPVLDLPEWKTMNPVSIKGARKVTNAAKKVFAPRWRNIVDEQPGSYQVCIACHPGDTHSFCAYLMRNNTHWGKVGKDTCIEIGLAPLWQPLPQPPEEKP